MTAPVTPASDPIAWWRTPVPWTMLGTLVIAVVALFNPTWVDAHHLSAGVQSAAVGLATLVNLAGLLHHYQWHNAAGLITPANVAAVETDVSGVLTAIESGNATAIIDAVGKAMTDLAGIVAPLVPVNALPAVTGTPPPTPPPAPPGPPVEQAA